MMLHGVFKVAAADVDALIGEARVGRLVTVDYTGAAHVGLYPFVPFDDLIQIHLTNPDPQLEHLRRDARCVFHIDHFHAMVPSHWVDPRDGRSADLLYRSVSLRGRVRLEQEATAVARHLDSLIERYQGAGGHAAVASNRDMYGASLARLTLVEIRVDAREVKFKLAQHEPVAAREAILDGLRSRSGPGDAETAAQVGRYLENRNGERP